VAVEKIFRTFGTHQQADAASLADARQLTTAQRLAAFLQLMKPVYESSSGLQRVYRTRDLRETNQPQED